MFSTSHETNGCFIICLNLKILLTYKKHNKDARHPKTSVLEVSENSNTPFLDRIFKNGPRLKTVHKQNKIPPSAEITKG